MSDQILKMVRVPRSEVTRVTGASGGQLELLERRGQIAPERGANGWRAYRLDDVQRIAEYVVSRRGGQAR